MLPGKIKFTPKKTEEVLSEVYSFRRDPECNKYFDTPVYENLKGNVRDALGSLEIVDHPDTIPLLRKKMRESFLTSIMTPGINEGIRAASANIEPVMQAVLKSSHSAGSKNGAGNPVNELLTMSKSRVAEYIYAGLDCGIEPVQWFVTNYDIDYEYLPIPSGVDDALKVGVSTVTSPLSTIAVKQPNGSFVATKKMLGKAILEQYMSSPIEGAIELGKYYIFQTINFSVAETLKLHMTPFDVLKNIKAYFKNTEDTIYHKETFFINISDFQEDIFVITVHAKNLSVGYAITGTIPLIGEETNKLKTFEILQAPVTQLITQVLEIPASSYGLAAYRKIDGTPAHTWLVKMASPSSIVPAKYLTLYFMFLGFRVVSCEYNSYGRCNSIRIAEMRQDVVGEINGSNKNAMESLIGWCREEYNKIDAWQTLTGYGNSHWSDEYKKFRLQTSAEQFSNESLTTEEPYTWRTFERSTVRRYTIFTMLKFCGNAATTYSEFLASNEYDQDLLYTNLVPTMIQTSCSHVARQVMDLEWSACAGDPVTQTAMDVLTSHGCGMGPYGQGIGHGSVSRAGVLHAMNENPNSVFTTAAALGKTHITDGTQDTIVTGGLSRYNGAASIATVDADNTSGKTTISSFSTDTLSRGFKMPKISTRLPETDDVPDFLD